MTAFEAVSLFAKQIERSTGLKVIIVPSPIKDAAATVRLGIRKVLNLRDTQAHRIMGKREVRLTVAIDGKVESLTGLRLAVEACETMSAYLASARRLEDEGGVPLADHSIEASSNPDDGILEDPDNGEVAWVRDEHFVTISIPL